ncbi:hydrogenase 4 subunit D [Niveibacterium umoris]|uniref:Hydrogenase-4 component D n=1 Tax=Niveibacterium umoris TaxID=1193620 RepID=A0A840BGJ3_9RHOO|nr:hydrogenase 4 subunit D [Niveibacterium umoris]MBB4012671.1 hydrogenase-4 component D [Niveibacterium umoris]
MQNLALATILLPFAGAALTVLGPQRMAKWVALLFAALASLSVIQLALAFSAAGKTAATTALLSLGSTVLMGLTIDRISVLVAVAVVTLGFLVIAYSTAYLSLGNREHPHEGRPRYYAFLLLFIGAMAGLVLSSTLIGQLVFFEITGACSWGLIGYYEKPKALQSAIKALLITHVASIGLYVAAAYLFVQTGSFELTSLSGLGEGAKVVVFLGILIAAWGKSAQLPLHAWLPDAMEAPTPVSAYLHAASMVKVGVYIYARAIYSAGAVPEIIGWVGTIAAVITMLYGFLMYLPQKDMKRLLAYSTISQLSLIFMALSLSIFGSQLAFNGGIAHIFNHAFAKSLFFLVAGALSYSCGTRMLPSLRGLLRHVPLLGVSFCVAALGITGVPPFNGFFSKFAIFSAGFQLSSAHLLLLPLVVLALIESVASFAWFLRWFGDTTPGEASEAVANAQPVPLVIKLVLAVLIVMCVASSFIAAAWLG